jgi:hypothetical protein
VFVWRLVYPSFIYSYDTFKKSHWILPKLIQNGLWSKHFIALRTSIEIFGTIWLRAFSCLKSRE